MENSLKVAVQMLSKSTSADDLVKLLRATIYLDRQDVCHKVIELLPQKTH
jgi:hypothetical protein